jgi:FAD/FMN-containing dehydrogenase
MVILEATTLSGGKSIIGDEAVEEFRTKLRGNMILPGDDSYDEVRTVWNAMIDRKSALIVRCAGVSDVINSVNFARDNDLLLAVRGGGHSFAGNAVCDGGIVIDLSPMQGVHVDPVNQTARAEPGVRWINFDIETQAFGLATTGGTNSDTGIGGAHPGWRPRLVRRKVRPDGGQSAVG